MMDHDHSFPLRRIKSFVRRDGRMTEAQSRALDFLMPRFGLQLEQGMLDFATLFQRDAASVLEIGFGSGYSLLAMAKQHPEQNFIGIETHLPGVGTLLHEMVDAEVNNIRIFHADAVEVLNQCIPDGSLDTMQIFFPDPWQKRRHHKRRLIQVPFMQLVLQKLKMHGTLHLATDWQDYAVHMMNVLTSLPPFENLAGSQQYANRSSHRPVITKFESRGQQSGRPIWELQFKRVI